VTGTDIVAISVDVGYVTSVFEKAKATIGPAADTVGKTVEISEVSSGLFRVTIFSISNNTPIGNGVVAYLTLNILSNAPGSEATLTNIPSASDPLGEELPVKGSDGTVTILGYLAGDCNDDGTVSIAEVQSAINMALDIIPVEDCVDVNGNGKVSISEVQKVINNHLSITGQDILIDLRGNKILVGKNSSVPLLRLATLTSAPGETIIVPITLDNSPGYDISAILTDISYDSSVFENPTVQIGPAGSAADKDVLFNEISPGILRIGVSGLNQNLIGDGVVAYVIFDIKADAAIDQSTLQNSPEASDPSGNDVPIEGENGTITLMTILYVSHDGICNSHEPCFSFIQNAIDASNSITLINVTEGTYEEDLLIDQPKEFNIQGGWDSTFASPSEETKTNSMTIIDGTVVFDEGCLVIGE